MTDVQEIESYLNALRAALAPIALAEREEIVREIGAHLRDSVESGVTTEQAIRSLGPATELAAQYRDGLLIRRASGSISPILHLRAALRLATKGAFGVLVFFLGTFGYLIGGGLVLSGLLKPLFPTNTGVWFAGGHFVSSGTLFPAPQPPAHEVLGMWYVLVGLIAGSLLLLSTSFAIRRSLRVSQRWQARI